MKLGKLRTTAFVMIALSSVAQAQQAVPQTRPSAPGTGTLTNVAPAVPLPPPRPQQPEVQDIGRETKSSTLEASKCNDIKADERRLQNQIIQKIRAAARVGGAPAMAIENGQQSPAQMIDARASEQAGKVAGALFAAIKNPKDIADAASDKVSGDSNRRATMKLTARCADEASFKKVIDNDLYTLRSGEKVCRSGDPAAVSMSTSQVFESPLSMDDVKNRFARAKLVPTAKNVPTYCVGSYQECARPEAYQQATISNFSPRTGKDYFFQDTTSFSSMTRPMVNRSSMRIDSVDVCGAQIYLVTGFANGNSLGFDRSSLVGVIARIGNKTLVVGDVSAQSMQQGSWPSWFPSYGLDVMDTVYGEVKGGRIKGGYPALAELIGSTERPVGGVIGGSPVRGAKTSVPAVVRHYIQ